MTSKWAFALAHKYSGLSARNGASASIGILRPLLGNLVAFQQVGKGVSSSTSEIRVQASGNGEGVYSGW